MKLTATNRTTVSANDPAVDAIEQSGSFRRLPSILDMTRTLISQGWPAVSAFAEASTRIKFAEKWEAMSKENATQTNKGN